MPLRILSVGAGVQSSTVLLMALHGEFPETLDAVSGKRNRVANPPFFVRNRDEKGEYASCCCTRQEGKKVYCF